MVIISKEQIFSFSLIIKEISSNTVFFLQYTHENNKYQHTQA